MAAAGKKVLHDAKESWICSEDTSALHELFSTVTNGVKDMHRACFVKADAILNVAAASLTLREQLILEALPSMTTKVLLCVRTKAPP